MAGPSLGTNLSGIVDWSTAFPFVDLFRMSRPWYTQSDDVFDTGQAGMLDLDAKGWVRGFTRDGSAAPFDRVSTILNTAGDYLREGHYVIDWKGQGRIEIGGDVQIVSRSANRIVIDPGSSAVEIQIHATDPAGTGNYIRDLRMYHEKDAPLLEAGVVFNPDFLHRIEDFRVLRFMDWMGTNNSDISTWAQAPVLGSPRQSLLEGTGGASIDVMVQLANEVRADPWFNIPHAATDGYVRALATYARDHLAPGLHARFEYSNEVWNWGFDQADYAQAQGRALWGDVDGAWMQWYGKRSAEVARIVAQVFGDETGTRALNVFSTQAGWQGLESYALDAPDFVAHGGRPPRDAPFHVYAIAPYFGGSLGSEEMAAQVDTWIAQGKAGIRAALDYIESGPAGDSLANIGATIAYHAGVAQSLGWQLEGYEGGQHIVDLAGLFGGEEDPARTAFFLKLVAHPRMQDFYQDYFETWRDSGGGLLAQFSDFGPADRYGSWGLWDSVDGPDTPRSIAVEQFRDTVDAWWQDARPASTFDGVRTLVDRAGVGSLLGGAGTDRLFGLEGRDHLKGLGGSDALYGGSAADRLFGEDGADRLFGGSDRDLLRGGTGRDVLTGGAADDQFVFATLAEAGDRITDFHNVPGDNDLIRIDASNFGGRLPEGTTLAASQFRVRADNQAQDSNDRFIFRTTDRTLWFDSNGHATGGLSLVADLQAGAHLTSSDILLV
ncbi:calcium-binding protein [Rubellimicrobium arenae]|uniref:calcium-binding protein n=1 Tax=Rubellimicrobium arenae TaxID=2817372 RepID=UPI001B31056F|nr:calcium-binding protein [Rubellimicrobium arenae]